MFDLSAIADSIRLIAIFFSVILLSYAGIVLITNNNAAKRNEWKEIATAVLIGLCILFLAPVISTSLVGGGYCSA